MPSKTDTKSIQSHDEPVRVSPTQVKRIAIIGGGASGAIALDSLIKEGHASEIVLFERREKFGGIWIFDNKESLDPVPRVTVGATSAELDPPLPNPFLTNPDERANIVDGKLQLEASVQERFEPTPAYEKMRTNIIEKMMTYSDEKHWGDAPGEQYTERESVQKYIERYYSRNQHNDKVRIELKTTVEDVARIHKPDAGIPHTFQATLRQRRADGTDIWYQESFDSIIVATGHYHIPFIPEVPGSKFVEAKYPTVFEHSKFFTNGKKYQDKTIVVVGSRSSGADLTRFTSQYAKQVYQSIRTASATKRFSQGDNIEAKPVIEKYVETETGFDVVFADGSRVSDPDHVVYATGYQYSYPFLKREFGDVAQNGLILPQAYQHTFLVNEPLIAILGAPADAISFRAFEYQAILITRFLAGKVSLPSRKEQEEWLQNRYKLHGESRAYHTIGPFEARNYMKELTHLGALKNGEAAVGREFPEITEAEVEEYRNAGLELSRLWNEDW